LVFDKNIEDCGAVTGSRELLAHAISNLLENAIKYTPKGGRIGLRLTPVRDGVEISVSDTGPGIPASERGRVLERFVRLDRSEDTPGTGLGLSLVDAVAKLHHAQLSLSDAHPGLVVTLTLPRA
jgi:signal transduction histidine kinase